MFDCNILFIPQHSQIQCYLWIIHLSVQSGIFHRGNKICVCFRVSDQHKSVYPTHSHYLNKNNLFSRIQTKKITILKQVNIPLYIYISSKWLLFCKFNINLVFHMHNKCCISSLLLFFPLLVNDITC